LKHYRLRVICGLFILIFIALLPNNRVNALQGEPEGPIYIIQPGDSLWNIALRFRVSVNDLASINGISDPNQLVVGDQLIIPGLTGISGILTTRTVAYGDTLISLSRLYQVPIESLVRLNHLTSPAELYVGATFVIPEQNTQTVRTRRALLVPGQSVLELAINQGTNPWLYVLSNKLPGAWSVIPGDVLHLPIDGATTTQSNETSALPDAITNIQIKPDTLAQGKTMVVQITGKPDLFIRGALGDRKLNFFPQGSDGYVSLQGIHAMSDPGLYSLVMTITLRSYPTTPFTYSQAVLVNTGDYPFDPVLKVDPDTIDPTVTQPEDDQWRSLITPVTPDKLWNGVFQSPVSKDFSECWPSRYGNRRSYNGSAYMYFHTGLDFCGNVGNDIYSPANGLVIFTGNLTVRGNATVIDHGWGVYTGYLHQSEILVKVGDRVNAGQLIGRVGKTGRVTGPHLHWDVWVGGVQVDPMDWLLQIFP
jgi:murein DD-endopeptidase MepM/ murein hydrolase activator NlpD